MSGCTHDGVKDSWVRVVLVLRMEVHGREERRLMEDSRAAGVALEEYIDAIGICQYLADGWST